MKVSAYVLLSMALLGLCAPAQAARLLVDFGRNDVATGGGQGAITPSPDINGNYWNNFNKEAFTPDTGSLDVPDNASISGLVTVANVATGIGIQLLDLTGNDEWLANGAANGGLVNPNPALLGDLAIPTATRDYFFTQQSSASFVLNGLNPLATYDLKFFGTRNTAAGDNNIRNTQFRATGANGALLSLVMQTSGAGAGSGASSFAFGNDDSTVDIVNLVPDANNSIKIDMLTNRGGFAYIAILDITENVAVPEPAAGLLLVLGGVFSLINRRAAR
jgi:hypothetical protein